MATKRLKAWFFAITSELRADGTTGGVRLRKTDKPTQSTMQDLLESTAFTTESADRAKVSTGATLASEQGLSVLASDVQAKANATQLADRSLVTQPHQLPTSAATTNSGGYIEDMPSYALQVNADSGITTRNEWLFNLAPTWIIWLVSRLFKAGGIEGDVPIKTSGTNYAWQYQNPGNNSTIVNAIANNTNFVNTLLANSTFITNITNTIITNNPAAITEALEVGFMRVHPVTAMPSAKWLRCDGSAISRTTYATLYNLLTINNTVPAPYGIGDGSTTFNLPDLRDKQITGYSGTKAIGSTFGTETHTLIGDNLPPHNHSLGGATGTTDTVGDHDHTNASGVYFIGTPSISPALEGAGPPLPYYLVYEALDFNVNLQPDGSHSHTVTLSAGNTGNGPGIFTEVNHLDPYLATNIIIKVLP